jgi:hypothetical protein
MPEQKVKKGFYPHAHWYFLLALLVIIIGFFRSYFLRMQQTDLWHHLHGMAALLWMLLLCIQPVLFNRAQLSWHRRLGKFSLLLVPFLVVSACIMVHAMLNSTGQYPPGVVYQLSFLDFFYMLQLSLFYSLALVYRKKIHLHARYMSATVFIFLLPGLARALFLLPFITSFNASLNTSYLLVEICLLLLLRNDAKSGLIRTPYLLALVLFLLQHVLMFYVGEWHWWRGLMDGYAGWL